MHPSHEKLYSNWPLKPRNQSSKLNFFKKLEKIFVCTLEVSRHFLLLSTQNICFYTLSVKKIINFITALAFVYEQKKLSFVLYSFPGSYNSVMVSPIKMKIDMFYHMKNTFWNTVFLDICRCAFNPLSQNCKLHSSNYAVIWKYRPQNFDLQKYVEKHCNGQQNTKARWARTQTTLFLIWLIFLAMIEKRSEHRLKKKVYICKKYCTD